MSPEMAGLLSLAVLLLLLLAGLPIAFTFPLVGFLGILYITGEKAAIGVLQAVPFTWASEYALLSLPLFILMGDFAFHSGISRDLYVTAYKWLGHLPGGLGIATMAACTAFAACTGSSVASAGAMGSVAIPEMKRYNYTPSLATAIVAMGGTLGILIPPSSIFIVYGLITEESIGKLFMAGVLPGLLLSTMYVGLIFTIARLRPAAAPAGERTSWKEKVASLRSTWGMLFIMLVVIGGIWGGVFTPTEAAGIGAFAALLLSIVRRKLSKKAVVASLTNTIRTTAMVFAILVGAVIYTRFLTFTGIATQLADWVTGLGMSPYVIIAAMILMYVPLGMFLDGIGMIVLTVPIFFPVVTGLGFSGIWFGVLVVIMAEVGLVTPPVAMNVFVIAGVAKDVPLADIFRGLFPFIAVALVGVTIIAAFPQISLWLPGTMFR